MKDGRKEGRKEGRKGLIYYFLYTCQQKVNSIHCIYIYIYKGGLLLRDR